MLILFYSSPYYIKVLDCILCCFVALASEDFRDISSLVEKEDFVQTLIRLLDTHSVNDPLGTIPNERLKLSKPEKMSVCIHYFIFYYFIFLMLAAAIPFTGHHFHQNNYSS